MQQLTPEQQSVITTYHPWIGDVAVDALPEFIRDRLSNLNCAFGRAGEPPEPNSKYWPHPYSWEEMEGDLQRLMFELLEQRESD